MRRSLGPTPQLDLPRDPIDPQTAACVRLFNLEHAASGDRLPLRPKIEAFLAQCVTEDQAAFKVKRSMARRKVLQVLYSGLGGHGSVAFSLAREAAKAGDWDNAFLFVGIEPVLPEYLDRVTEMSADWRSIKQSQGRSVMSWPAVMTKIYSMRPDAVILHSIKSILPAASAAYARRIPLIAVEHQPNHLKRRAEWWVSHAAMRLADVVVLLTPQYADELRSGLGSTWREDKVRAIPNGVDTSAFSPRTSSRTRLSERRRPIEVGFAARFTNKKRQDDLADAVEMLVARDGRDAWRLSLAGEGETRQALMNQVAARGLEDIIRFPGFLAEEELIDWFTGLDIYVHASDGETLSTSILQAMAMGLPILGSNVPGIANLLESHPSCGLLTDRAGPNGLADGLTRLVSEPHLASELAQAARRRAEAEFSQSSMFQAYDALIEPRGSHGGRSR